MRKNHTPLEVLGEDEELSMASIDDFRAKHDLKWDDLIGEAQGMA
jgi:hypothetical protein